MMSLRRLPSALPSDFLRLPVLGGGVDEVDAGVQRVVDDLDAFLNGDVIGNAERRRAQGHDRHVQLGPAKDAAWEGSSARAGQGRQRVRSGAEHCRAGEGAGGTEKITTWNKG